MKKVMSTISLTISVFFEGPIRQVYFPLDTSGVDTVCEIIGMRGTFSAFQSIFILYRVPGAGTWKIQQEKQSLKPSQFHQRK